MDPRKIRATEARPVMGDHVLVVDDDALLGEHIAFELALHGLRPLIADDYAEGLKLAACHRPAVIVLDQIVETAAGAAFLRQLEALGDLAPFVVLLRYNPGPVGAFSNLRVTVVGGEHWFEQLPSVVTVRMRWAGVTRSAVA